MKRYKLLSLLLFSVFAVGLLTRPGRAPAPPSSWPPDTMEKARALFPEATLLTPLSGPAPHVRASGYDSARGRQIITGYVFRTHDLAPEVNGYSGPIDVMVGLSPQGAITGIMLLQHQETSSYIKNIDAFLHQFLNRTAADPLVLGLDIDAISQATITSAAITRAVRQSLALMASNVLPAGIKPGMAPSGSRSAFPIYQLLIPAALFLLALSGIILKQKTLRRLALCGGLLYFGLWSGTMLAAVQLANIAGSNLPDFLTAPLWYAIIGGAVLSSLTVGMVYCGSLCPFAAVQEILYTLGQKILRRTCYPAPTLDYPARYFKHILLITTLAAALALGNPEIADTEVYVTLFTRHGSLLAWTLLALMLVAALFHYRFWCKYFCPTGAFTGLLSRWSLMKIRIGDACNSCQRCRDICPTQAIKNTGDKKPPAIDSPECILCQECIRQCPKGAMVFSYAKHKQSG